MTSCAIVPTTISDSAVDILNQIESRLATNARPSHKAAKAQTLVISPSILEGRGERRQWHNSGMLADAGSSQASCACRSTLAGVISRNGGFGGLHPRRLAILAVAPTITRPNGSRFA